MTTTQRVDVERTIKPCPFCGETPTVDNIRADENQGTKWGGVVCQCGVVGPEVRTRYAPVDEWADRAIDEWNKRAETPDLTAKLAERDAEIEAVVGAKEHWRKAAEGNYLAKEAAQRAREECVADVERRFLSVRDMLPGDYITGYTEALAHIRAAFLAANGGRDEA